MKKITLPGLIDPHVHLRDPGATHKEDFVSGASAARAGGFSWILDMPNNPQPTITREALDDKLDRVRSITDCHIGFIFGASQKDNTGEFGKVVDDVFALKIYMDTTTGDLLLEEKDILERAFAAWPSQKPIVVHAEGETMEKAISLARKFDKHLHIAHLSQKSELIRVIEEKENGVPVTCEVTPHHLFLTENDVPRLKGYGIMKPPLKTQEDVDFLWKHIDAIDCIATDHAPHTIEEKGSDNPPYGVPGLETSLSLMLTAVKEGRIVLDDIVRLMHEGPKRIFAIPVSDDPVLTVDMNVSYTIDSKLFKSKSKWSPFDGMKVWGAWNFV